MRTEPLADIEADWPRISGLLDEVMNLPPASRETFIASLPPPDDRLGDTLRELLALQAKVETEDFMDDLPVFPGLVDLSSIGAATGGGGLVEGAEVGPYRLLRPIGEGGMGAVWLAERADGTLKRKVALKLPRLAWAQDLAARMARERDILAGLEHPNIARLYDAGLDAQGRPWLALEFIEGRDLDTYCDAERLDLRARVRLFMQVLEAVQYAHASLVIHRDIKPANILVTPRGEARLLDFGIARLEEGATEAGPDLTRTGASAMTPRYASPEQVQGLRLTVASDIYSLGVVLHELLTGETPYVLRRSSRAELEQAILDSDLRVPSRIKATGDAAAARATTPERIARDLRGDLDAVLLRALARAPAARYASAAAFRDDLGRWLEGRPVSAMPPSRLHTLRKFVARNRLAVAASAAAALALVAVSVVAVLQAQRAMRSAEAARAEAARANATVEFVTDIFNEADPTRYGGREPTARDLIVKAEASIDQRLAGQPRVKAEVLDFTRRIWALMGDADRSQRSLRRRSEALLAAGDPIAAADSMLSEADLALTRRDYAGLTRQLADIEALVPDDRMPVGIKAKVHFLRGYALGQQRDRTEAFASLDRAESALDEVDPATPIHDRQVIRYQVLLARASLRGSAIDPQTGRADLAEAESLLPAFAGDPDALRAQRAQLALTRYRIGDYERGWPDMQRTVDDIERLLGADNPNVAGYRRYWLLYCWRTGRVDIARSWLEKVTRDPGVPGRRFETAYGWRATVSRILIAEREWASASTELERARRDLESEGRAAVADRALREGRAELDLLTAELSLRRGDLQAVREALTGMESVVGADPSLLGEPWNVEWIAGIVARLEGSGAKSVEHLRRAESTAVSTLTAAHPIVARLRLDLALALSSPDSGADDRAVVSLIREASAALLPALPGSHPAVRFVRDIGSMTAAPSAAEVSALRRRLAATSTGTYFF